MKITGTIPFVAGGIRKVGEHRVDLSLFCKFSLVILSVKSLDMAKIFGYFWVKYIGEKVYIF